MSIVVAAMVVLSACSGAESQQTSASEPQKVQETKAAPLPTVAEIRERRERLRLESEGRVAAARPHTGKDANGKSMPPDVARMLAGRAAARAQAPKAQ